MTDSARTGCIAAVGCDACAVSASAAFQTCWISTNEVGISAGRTARIVGTVMTC